VSSEQFISSEGIRLHCVTDGDGPPIVLLHGYLGSGEAWDSVLPSLIGFRSIRVDLRGHGTSDGVETWTSYGITHQLADVGSVVSELAGGRAVLLGYSMGGRIALTFAIRNPDMVEGLILESASSGIENERERMQRRRLDDKRAEMIEREGFEAFLAEWETIPVLRSQLHIERELAEKTAATRRATQPAAAAGTIRAMSPGRVPSVTRELSNLSCPVTLIAGALDKPYVSNARKMAGRMNMVDVVIVDGAGHAVHLEQPEKCRAAVKTALERIVTIQKTRDRIEA
jgi:2-succinyl-6-hydroxy-2,4-cyclohexadiene-1-carboxylate synthase